MKNPFKIMLRASRLTKRKRPLAAAMVLQQMLLPSPKPKPKPARVRKRITVKPAMSGIARKSAIAPRPLRPMPGTFIDGRFESPHGRLAYKLYTPNGSTRRRMPLVVMLHGCTQSASDFAAGTGMNALADELGFLVLYPEQSASANLGRCWNWHRPGDQKRGSGEPAAIAALTLHAMKMCRANPARIYIAGLSAGGAAAAIIAAAYPELYVAVGVHSGVAIGCVSTLNGAMTAMRTGSSGVALGKSPRPQPTIVFHGDEDNVVHPANASGFLTQLQQSRPGPLACQVQQGRVNGGRGFTRRIYRTGSGTVLLEDWTVHGGGHAWSGGKAAGTHTDPAGPDAAREIMRYFLARTQSL